MKFARQFRFNLSALFIVFGLATFQGHALAQCANVQAVYRTASGSAGKCGYTEFCGASTPPKYYLQQQEVDTASCSYYTASWGIDVYTGLYTYNFESVSCSYSTTTTTTYNSADCSKSTHYIGTAAYHELDGSPEGVYPWDLSGTMSPDGSWSDSGDAYSQAGYFMSYEEIPGVPFTETCTSTMDTGVSSNSGQGSDSNDTDSWTGKITYATTLSSEFTDSMLRGIAMAQPSFQTYSPWTPNTAASFGSAKYSLSPNHDSASVAKMQYYFHIADCQPRTSYWVTWDQVTTYPNNNSAPSVQHMQEDIEGTGDPAGTDGSIHTVDVPGSPSTITEQNIKVEYSIWDTPGL